MQPKIQRNDKTKSLLNSGGEFLCYSCEKIIKSTDSDLKREWEAILIVEHFAFGKILPILLIHLTGAATNPWMRFESNDSFIKFQIDTN